MKRSVIKLLFRHFFTFILCLLFLTGCGKNRLPEDANPLSDHNVSEDQALENGITENGASVSELFDTIISENQISENEVLETAYIIGEDDIINLEEAFENWSDIYDAQRSITIEEGYVDKDAPVELQDMMIYCNDGIYDEKDEYWKEYIVDCKEITEENKDNYPIEDIVLDAHDYTYLKVLDIDGDGENEYFHSIPNGNSGWSYLCFHKNVEGKWIDLTVSNSQSGNVILFYGDKYYIWSGNNLRWWNDEIETPQPNPALIDGNPCWNTIAMAQLPTEYTLYELYSNVQDESIDFLENISLDCEGFINFINNDVEKVEVESSHIWWQTDTGTISPRYGWEKSYNGEQYLYVVTEIYSHAYIYLESWDKQLVIMHQTQDGAWEIDKVYYLMAGFKCFLN